MIPSRARFQLTHQYLDIIIKKKRLIISYFPHQSFSQFLDTNNKNINNKGFTIMRELVDLIILAGGVMLRFNKNGRAEII